MAVDHTVEIKNETVKSLRVEYANKGSVARLVFDRLAGRQRLPRNGYTTADQVLYWFGDHDLIRADVITFFKRLASLEVGTFLIGRRDWPTRLEWLVNPIVLSKVVIGERDEVGDVPLNEEEYLYEEESEEQSEEPVKLRLRSGVTVRIEGLPPDLTPTEAERLAMLIRAIPIVP